MDSKVTLLRERRAVVLATLDPGHWSAASHATRSEGRRALTGSSILECSASLMGRPRNKAELEVVTYARCAPWIEPSPVFFRTCYCFPVGGAMRWVVVRGVNAFSWAPAGANPVHAPVARPTSVAIAGRITQQCHAWHTLRVILIAKHTNATGQKLRTSARTQSCIRTRTCVGTGESKVVR